jgi:site-specific DNA-methyltransferase (adenine-specific)
MTVPYYQDEWVTLYHGDCFDVMPELPTASIDTLVTDPPYMQPVHHYSIRHNVPSKTLSDLSILEHGFRVFFAEATRVLRLDGTGYMFCDGQSYPSFFRAAYDKVHRVRPLVWDKITSFNGYDWRHQHELILYFTMPQTPQIATGSGDIIRSRAVPIDEREHLAQKPTALLECLIAQTCPPHGMVLDPFMGSGSSLIAAKRSGRTSIGVDADERYCEITARRLDTMQDVLQFEETG